MSPHNKTSEAEEFENLEHDGLKIWMFKQTMFFLFASKFSYEASLEQFYGNAGHK